MNIIMRKVTALLYYYSIYHFLRKRIRRLFPIPKKSYINIFCILFFLLFFTPAAIIVFLILSLAWLKQRKGMSEEAKVKNELRFIYIQHYFFLWLQNDY